MEKLDDIDQCYEEEDRKLHERINRLDLRVNDDIIRLEELIATSLRGIQELQFRVTKLEKEATKSTDNPTRRQLSS